MFRHGFFAGITFSVGIRGLVWSGAHGPTFWEVTSLDDHKKAILVLTEKLSSSIWTQGDVQPCMMSRRLNKGRSGSFNSSQMSHANPKHLPVQGRRVQGLVL